MDKALKTKSMSRFELRVWLKRAVKVVVVSISLAGGVSELKAQSDSLTLLKSAAASKVFFPKGRYIVEYLPNSDIEEEVEQELALIKTIVAVSYSARLKVNDVDIGDTEILKKIIADEDYFFISHKDERVLSVVIKQPDSPDDLVNLVKKLQESRIAFFSIENGSGYMLDNYIFGAKQMCS